MRTPFWGGETAGALARFSTVLALQQALLDQLAQARCSDRLADADSLREVVEGRPGNLPPEADLRAVWTEFVELATRPGFQACIPLIADVGLDEVERNLGHYAGIANQQA